jgi:hypothetical protein
MKIKKKYWRAYCLTFNKILPENVPELERISRQSIGVASIGNVSFPRPALCKRPVDAANSANCHGSAAENL